MNESGLFGLAPLVVFLPLVGMLINIGFGGQMIKKSATGGERAVGLIASLASGGAFVIAVLLGIALAGHPEGITIPFLDWISSGDFSAQWAFRVDTLSVTMMLVVSGIGTLIHIYAIGYMHDDVRHHGDEARFPRFFVFLNLFIAMMMILVSADNYLMMFVGWEGVGLCSYLLIGFWYDKGKDNIGNALAAKKAFITNRVGDFGFLMALFMMVWAFGTLNFEEMAARLSEVLQNTPTWVIPAIGFFLLLGVTGKSAQLPLYVWLPDAMAGPTPVSALIHAATMVTAGVYLMVRANIIFALSYEALPALETLRSVVTIVGVATAFFAATIAVAQFDIKKVLAYSTISQLGFMVAAVGMGASIAAMFHLVTHAFFKGLLFLAAGSVIQGVERGEHAAANSHGAHGHDKAHGAAHGSAHTALDPQDMRNMGGLAGRMKLTFTVYLIGALALAGIPPLAGFWSKDEILTSAIVKPMGALLFLSTTAFLTAFYMGRQIWLIFLGKSRSRAAENASESSAIMTVPLMILAALSLVGGFLNLPGVHTFALWLEHTLPVKEVGEFVPWVAVFSSIVALLAIALAWFVYGKIYVEQQSVPPAHRPDDPLRPALAFIFTWMEGKWYIDELYGWLFLKPYAGVSRFLAQTFDPRLIDGAANGLARLTQWSAGQARRIQTGYLRSYALAMMIGLVLILGYLTMANLLAR